MEKMNQRKKNNKKEEEPEQKMDISLSVKSNVSEIKKNPVKEDLDEIIQESIISRPLQSPILLEEEPKIENLEKTLEKEPEAKEEKKKDYQSMADLYENSEVPEFRIKSISETQNLTPLRSSETFQTIGMQRTSDIPRQQENQEAYEFELKSRHETGKSGLPWESEKTKTTRMKIKYE